MNGCSNPHQFLLCNVKVPALHVVMVFGKHGALQRLSLQSRPMGAQVFNSCISLLLGLHRVVGVCVDGAAAPTAPWGLSGSLGLSFTLQQWPQSKSRASRWWEPGGSFGPGGSIIAFLSMLLLVGNTHPLQWAHLLCPPQSSPLHTGNKPTRSRACAVAAWKSHAPGSEQGGPSQRWINCTKAVNQLFLKHAHSRAVFCKYHQNSVFTPKGPLNHFKFPCMFFGVGVSPYPGSISQLLQ